ncbi:MAG TPA: sulfite exporter TauE/SafE family protein, partial [Bacillota bacterium]|nr:sulfite exporter TauE/SafE family protein [Bacillota bacterium]
QSFSLYFGLLMLIIFFMMLIDREKLMKNKQLEITDKTRTFVIDNETYQYNVRVVPAFILSFAVGLLSGLFGIGGGTISVPAMILFFGIPVQIAIGTSMFMIFFISLISSSTHIILGHIVWKYMLFFVIGSYVGGTVGARTSKLFKGKTLEWFLKIVIVIAAIRLIYESFQ